MESNAGQKFLELFNKLEAEAKRKEDVMTSLDSLRINEDFILEGTELGRVKLTDHAFSQLCQQVYEYPLPADYFKRLFEDNPEQFKQQFNYHLQKGRSLDRKFRTVKGEDGISEVRGIVSKSYVPYDHLDVLHILKDTLSDRTFDVQNLSMDDKMMFLRLSLPDTEKNFGRSYDGQDDRNFIAIDILNSEVGYTSISANPSIFRLICTNGMVAKQAEYGFYKQRHMHIDPFEVNRNLSHSITYGIEMGTEMLANFEVARKIKVENPYELITDYGKRRAIASSTMKTVRDNYDIEADRSLFGVVNAFTRTARDLKSVEKRIDLEKYASVILEKELKKSA